METGLIVQTHKPALLRFQQEEQLRKQKLVIRPFMLYPFIILWVISGYGFDIGRRKLIG